MSETTLWSEGPYEIQLETLREAINSEGAEDLMQAHWEEIAHYKDKVPLAPQLEQLQKMEDDGCLFILTLRENEELIGYAMWVTRSHLHYTSLTVVAVNDLIFVRKDKRIGGLGKRLMVESERAMRTIGAKKMQYHMKPHASFAPILERMGFIHEEIIYGKLLT
jgi:GNAT superfamily N-acetyltransferase